MFEIDQTIDSLDNILDSERKRHIIGGMLISIGVMCFGLAITALTLKEDYNAEIR